MMKKRIYPKDWKEIHPGNADMSTDSYYSQLASRVLDVLEDDGIDEVLDEPAWIRDAAVRITAWFEDLCNGTGLWSVVNTVCRNRYKRLLPFFDTSIYYNGEPNVQDIQLLLWDIIQSHYVDRIINPENLGIATAANDVLNIFDEEYETAPETEEMIDFLTNPALANDYWQARKAMEWFALDSYLSLRTRISFEESKPDKIKDEYDNIRVYHSMLSHSFFDRQNLLSLTAAEWLSAATGHQMILDDTLKQNRVYNIVSNNEETILLRDILNGNEVNVQIDSFDPHWLKQHRQTAKIVTCSIIGFNGKNYHFGTMFTNPSEEYLEKYKETMEDEERNKVNTEYTAELFQNATQGKPIVFVKGIDEFMDFHIHKMDSKVTDEFRKAMENHLRQNAESGMAAFMSDPEAGLLTITRAIPAIKAPHNPYYDKEYAQKNALDLIVEPRVIDYSAICTLLDNNYLPDAALTSIYGYEHGRALVQQNSQFMADYFFSQHR